MVMLLMEMGLQVVDRIAELVVAEMWVMLLL